MPIPAPIVEAIRADPVLVHHIVVSEIVVAVDALHALAQLRSEPLGRRQVEIADRLVVTKVDAAEEERAGAPAGDAASDQSRRGDLRRGQGLGGRPAGVGRCRAASRCPISPATPSGRRSSRRGSLIDETIDWTAFSVWLSALLHARGDDVLRVKGVVRTPAGRLLLQSVRKIVQSPEILPEQLDDAAARTTPSSSSAAATRGDDLERSLRYFAGQRCEGDRMSDAEIYRKQQFGQKTGFGKQAGAARRRLRQRLPRSRNSGRRQHSRSGDRHRAAARFLPRRANAR